jgi:hypothetical protein
MLEQQVMPNAEKLGVQLGTQLAAQAWQHVHFIAHSAGSALIQKASESLRNLAAETEIHTTFLDPYVDLNYYGRSWYGKSADWSDCYYAVDAETTDRTDGPLCHAYNVEVTWVDPNAKITTKFCYEAGTSDSTPIASLPCGKQADSNHEWPHQFYFDSIGATLQSCSGNYGFPLSKEAGSWNAGILTPGNAPWTPCSQSSVEPNAFPTILQPQVHFDLLPNARSGAGATLLGGSAFSLTTDDPAWFAAGLTISNAANFVQFDTAFTDTNSALGLLTVYWNTNRIGMLDELSASTNVRTYNFPLPATVKDGAYTISFRLDSFSNTISSVIVTNVTTGFIGLSEPITVGMSLDTNAVPILRLTAARGYNYLVQRSTNLSDWTSMALVPNTNGSVLFPDRSATNSTRRFYRVVAP